MLVMNREQGDGKMYATPPSPMSPNPYNRGGFLRRKSPPAPPRKSDLGVNSSARGRGATGTRPLPLRTPSDVHMTPRGRHTNETRGCSPASSRSASPQKPPWYPAGSPASSRSASPHKRPWYPAGCRPSSGDGESGRSSVRGSQENTYVVHPTFRHIFNETANRSDRSNDGDGASDVGVEHTRRTRTWRQHGPPVPGAGLGGSPCASPQTTATVSQRSESDRPNRSAIGERRRESENAYCFPKKPNLVDRQRQDKPALGGPRIDSNDINDITVSRRKDRNEGARTDKGEDGEHCSFRESVAKVRDRVRGLQSRGKPRIKENGLLTGSSRRRARPMPLSSAVFTGHCEQVLALAQHQDVLFSAAADGTAKAWDTYSHQCLVTYEGHRKAVWGMQVTNRTLITGSADGTVRFWDVETARPLHVIDMHSAVRDVVVVGGFIAVATANPSIEVIDLSCMKPHGTLEGHIMAVSALASLEGGARLVSGSHDTFIRVWDPDTGSCDAVLSGHGGTIGALCTMPSRPPAAVFSGAHLDRNSGGDAETNGESLIVSGSGDSTVRVWGRVGAGSDVGEWTCRAVLQGHRHGVWAVHGLSLSGGVFATGGGDATVKIWAPNTNTRIGEANGAEVMGGGGETASEQQQQQQRRERWECVGGVRGAAGAVGAVLMNEEALTFGTSEALIARFPLQLCMPKHRPS